MSPIPKRPAADRDAAAAAAARFAQIAQPDVAYAVVDTPVGKVVAASTRRGLACLAYEDFHGGVDQVIEELSAGLSPRILEAPARLDDVRRELDEYFEGRRHGFDLKLDFALVRTPFSKRLLQATARIPFGEVRTYRDMATAAGNAAAVRAAGNALGHNPIPIVVPCHRVLRTGGSLGGYTGGLERKQLLLAVEGIKVPEHR
jgi:methylated-DNA-[protein]-cysteine S-methyltransferase